MKYFTVDEMCKTNTGLANVPTKEESDNLVFLIEKLLDPARQKLGLPIKISSGFRSQAVNRRVGGVFNSQHTKGEAADLVCTNNAKLFEILKTMKFDQLIWEKGNSVQPAWVHVSIKRIGINRGQILKL